MLGRCDADHESHQGSEAAVARFLLICLGGAVGTGARYLLSVWAAQKLGTGFPFGTFIVNVLGSNVLAVLMELSMTGIISPEARLILGTGLVGGFTTYSTFNYETLAFAHAGNWPVALTNTVGTVLVCFAAGIAGLAAARAFGQ